MLLFYKIAIPIIIMLGIVKLAKRRCSHTENVYNYYERNCKY